MNITDKPHRRIAPSHGVVFWKGGAAANEETADRAVVYTGPPGMPYPEFQFKWPEERPAMERLERALWKAFESGVYSAKKEIRAMLGVVEGR